MRAIGFLALVLLVGCAQTSKPPEPYREAAYVSLPPYAIGSGRMYESPGKLVDGIVALGGAQADLETDAEFSSRMSALGRSVVFSKIRDPQVKFDKATGELSFSQLLSDAQSFGYRQGGRTFPDHRNVYLSIDMPDTDIVVGEFVGQNSFGVSALVDVVVSNRVYLVSPPIAKDPVGTIVVSLDSLIKLNSEQFKAQREDLRLAIVFDPVPGYVQLQRFYGTATIANKRKTTVNNYFFDVRLAAASLINIKTGQICSDVMRVKFKPL